MRDRLLACVDGRTLRHALTHANERPRSGAAARPRERWQVGWIALFHSIAMKR
jgi:hypothetical protein